MMGDLILGIEIIFNCVLGFIVGYVLVTEYKKRVLKIQQRAQNKK